MAEQMEVDSVPAKSTTVEKSEKKRFEVKKVRRLSIMHGSCMSPAPTSVWT